MTDQWGESNGDRWIPLIKGLQCKERFRTMKMNLNEFSINAR